MLGLKHHCPICGIEVEKETEVKRFGKHFCSNEHAQQYTERKLKEEENMTDTVIKEEEVEAVAANCN